MLQLVHGSQHMRYNSVRARCTLGMFLSTSTSKVKGTILSQTKTSRG